MNIFEAIRRVQENPHIICKSKNMKVMWFLNRVGFEVNRSLGDITAKELLLAEHEDFHEVIDWEKVPIGTKLICTEANGSEVIRYFAGEMGEETIKVMLYDGWHWYKNEARLAEDGEI